MLSKKFKERIESNRTCNDDIVKYLFKSKIIDRMLLEVCSDCQYNCVNCGHGSFKSVYKNYQMSIYELNRFLYYTKKSNYYMREVCLHGPGEPTLWKNLNEGIEILYKSNVVGGVVLLTNGVSLNKVKEETFQYLDRINISIYPDAKENDLITHLYQKFPEKIHLEMMNQFWGPPCREYPDSIPCSCACPVSLLIDNKIFYCSGTIFDAAKLKGVDVFDCHEVYTELKENYLDNFSRGNFDLCKYCTSNRNIRKQLKSYDHKLF
jgi:hypothetical protein